MVTSSELTWKEAITRIVLRVVQSTGNPVFRIDEIYGHERILESQFPNNRHIREKIRQSLQKLIVDGLLTRNERGLYSVDISSPELIVEASDHPNLEESLSSKSIQLPAGNEIVRQNRRITTIRLRNTILAIELKRAYQYKCQVCRTAVALKPPYYYAEGHHLRPLGRGHNGPDVPGNILVLCPNHHAMFDAGSAAIVPDSYKLVHSRSAEFTKDQKLVVGEWHHLDSAHVVYHFETIFCRS